MSASEELERGRLAAEVLANPVFRDALDRINQEIVTKWQAEREKDSREWLWALNQAAKRLEAVLIETMQTGQMRQQQIEMQQTRLEKAGKTLRRAFAD